MIWESGFRVSTFETLKPRNQLTPMIYIVHTYAHFLVQSPSFIQFLPRKSQFEFRHIYIMLNPYLLLGISPFPCVKSNFIPSPSCKVPKGSPTSPSPPAALKNHAQGRNSHAALDSRATPRSWVHWPGQSRGAGCTVAICHKKTDGGFLKWGITPQEWL